MVDHTHPGVPEIFKKEQTIMITRTEEHYINRINSLLSRGEIMNEKLIKKAKRNLRKLKKTDA